MRPALAVAICLAMVCPSGAGAFSAASASGAVRGNVTLDGRPLSGLDLSLVNIGTGGVYMARSGFSGDYELELAPGSYVIAASSDAGLAVGRGPAVVRVEAGKVVFADLELVALQVPAPIEPAVEPGTIQHDAVGCMLAGEFPIIDAVIQPATTVVRARAYFRSALSEEWYFVEMPLVDGVFRAWLPRPQLEASPVTYYLQASTTDFGETRTEEYVARVVEFEDECEDEPLAAYGTPPGDLTIFSASTGAAAGLPAGFAVGGGLAVGAGALALIGAGITAAGVGITQVTGDDQPTTTTVAPTAAPATPTPTPEPTPVLYNLTVLVAPSVAFGSVSVSPPDGPYPPDTRVSLEAFTNTIPASPPEQIIFVRWEQDCASFRQDPVCTLVMDRDKTVVAVFDNVPAP